MVPGSLGIPKGGQSIPTSDLDLPLSPLDALASQTRTVKLSIRREGRYAHGSGPAAGKRAGPGSETPGAQGRSGEELLAQDAAGHLRGGGGGGGGDRGGGVAGSVARPPANERRAPAGPLPTRLNLDNVSSLVASNWRSQQQPQRHPGSQDGMAGPAPFLGASGDAGDSPLGLSTAFQSRPGARGTQRPASHARKHSKDHRATRQSVMSFETDSTDYVWGEDDRSDLDGSSYTPGPIISTASDNRPGGLLRRPSTGQVRGGVPARRLDSEERFRSVYAEQGDGEEVLHTGGLAPPVPQHPDRHTWMSSATGDTLQTETTTDNDGLHSKYDSGVSVGTEDPFEFAKYETPRPAAPLQPSSSYPNVAPWDGPHEEDYPPDPSQAAAPPPPPQSRTRTLSVSTAASGTRTGVINYSRPLRMPSSPPAVPLPSPPTTYANDSSSYQRGQLSPTGPRARHVFAAQQQPDTGSAGPAVIISGHIPSAPPPLPPVPPPTHELRYARSRGSVESQSSAGTKRSGSKGRLIGKKPSLFKRRGSSSSRPPPDEPRPDSADWIDLRHPVPSPPPAMTFTDSAVGQGKLKEPVEEEVDRRWREEEEMRRQAEEEEERARWEAYDRTQNAIGQRYQQQAWQGEESHRNHASAYGGAYDDGVETVGDSGGHTAGPGYAYPQQHDRNASRNSEELDRARYSLYSLPPDDQLAHHKRHSLRPLGQFPAGSGGATDQADPRSAPAGTQVQGQGQSRARFAANLAAPNRESRLPAAMAKTKAALYFRPDLNGSSGAGGAETAQDYVQLGIEAHERGDLERSAGLFERAAREYGGCVGGMLMWGLTLRHGWGVTVNQERGFKWLQKAAESVVEDLDKTRRGPGDETKAAKSELVLAIYELGQCFRRGWGCKKDKQLAISYFELAAKLGDVDAQTELGFCYANGKGTKRDLKEAAKYYRMAARQGVQTMGLQWIWKEKYND